MRREWRLPTLRYRIIFDHCNPAWPNVIKGGSCLTPAVAVDVAAGVTQPGAQLCSQGLCEGELTLEKTNRANGDLNKRKKKKIRSQSYPTNRCLTLVHKPPFSSSLRPTCSCWTSYSDTHEFIWATFLLCSLQSFIFCFTERDSLCLHLIYMIVGIFLFLW